MRLVQPNSGNQSGNGKNSTSLAGYIRIMTSASYLVPLRLSAGFAAGFADTLLVSGRSAGRRERRSPIREHEVLVFVIRVWWAVQLGTVIFALRAHGARQACDSVAHEFACLRARSFANKPKKERVFFFFVQTSGDHNNASRAMDTFG